MSAPEVTLPIPHAATLAELLARAAEASRRGDAAVLATVLTRRGSAPATPGQKLLLTAGEACLGTVGGGALERQVLAEMVALLAVLERGELPAASDGGGPRTVAFNLGAGLGMCCGGGVDVLLEPLAPPATVVLVGAGHVATALAPLLVALGFALTVCDERDAWALEARFPREARVGVGAYRDVARAVSRRAAVLVMTHDHALDQEAIEWALRERFAFVGGVGSRAKIAKTRTRLEARGVAPADVARVRMPLGVAIGARSPEEIAVAIAAEMVAWRHGAALSTVERGAVARPAGVLVARAAPTPRRGDA